MRINASHGDHPTHKKTIENIRKLDEELGSHTSILVDLQGPKLRVGEIAGGEMELEAGSDLIIKVGDEEALTERFTLIKASLRMLHLANKC